MLLAIINEKSLIEKDQILDVANKSGVSYNKFSILKKDGTNRIIYQPSIAVRALQKIVYDNILNQLPVHEACYAYRKSVSLKDHASVHQHAKYLLRMDFTNFFESITRNDVEKFSKDVISKVFPQFKNNDYKLLANILCRKDKITIGSVTSPALSNAICFNLDEKISRVAKYHGVSYTRYADDLFFSTTKKGVLKLVQKEVINIIKKIDYPRFTLNKKKTRHSSKKKRMSVTGLTITVDAKLSIGRDKKRFIRSQIYQWDKLSLTDRQYLSGYLAFVRSVEPQYINNLCVKYSSELIQSIIRFKV
jgi:hypothetical protein